MIVAPEMPRSILIVAAACALVTACGPDKGHGPTPLPRLSRTRFLAFGDSLTSGEVTAPLSGTAITKLVVVPTAAYPAVLQSQLQSSYSSQASAISVTNQGRSGESIFDGVPRFRDVFASTQPEAVLLMEGVNDLGFAGPDVATGLMRLMVQAAKNGGARVFVGSMVPTLPNRQRSQNAAQLETYNAVLKLMCTQEGVTFVDLYNTIMPQADQLIGVDGLHPNEAGYRRIAELFFNAIGGELETR